MQTAPVRHGRRPEIRARPTLKVGPQDPKDVTRDVARDLSSLVGELGALKGDATHCLTDQEYAAVRHRLEAAHAATEVALVEARRRRVRLNERQGE